MHIDLPAPIWGIEEIAAVLELEVDSAREYTYREDFPRPRDGFSRNLWTREKVLDWFAGCRTSARSRRQGHAQQGDGGPHRVPSGRHPRGHGPGRHPPDRRPSGRRAEALHAEGEEVSRAGNPPIDTVGVVDIYAPTSTPYFRLEWPEPDGTAGTPPADGCWTGPGPRPSRSTPG
jgi:hypothetical protein